MIKFNKPYIRGNELKYIEDVIRIGHLSGDGSYTKKCTEYFKIKFGFANSLLTTNCTAALEMAAILAHIQPGDEVIMPSYTFVSSANAFVLRGAKIVFADSSPNHPNIDTSHLENLITNKTKAIVIVHYGGVACRMDEIMGIVNKYNLLLVEDAAHSIDAYYKGIPLGSFGDFSTFSFHETKNIACGEGGLLVIKDESLYKRAEIIREKGTNRSSFFRGEINKYGWVDIGSSYLPSEILSAFLFAQLEKLDEIQKSRIKVWNAYYENLNFLNNYNIKLPHLPEYASNNAHLFYLVCPNLDYRTKMIRFLLSKNIKAVFHYQPLHLSEYHLKLYPEQQHLPNAVKFADCLLRLPLYADLTNDEVEYIVNSVKEFVRLT